MLWHSIVAMFGLIRVPDIPVSETPASGCAGIAYTRNSLTTCKFIL